MRNIICPNCRRSKRKKRSDAGKPRVYVPSEIVVSESYQQFVNEVLAAKQRCEQREKFDATGRLEG